MRSPITFVDLNLCAMHLANYIEYMGRGWHTNNERIIRLTDCDHCRDCKRYSDEQRWKPFAAWRDEKGTKA